MNAAPQEGASRLAYCSVLPYSRMIIACTFLSFFERVRASLCIPLTDIRHTVRSLLFSVGIQWLVRRLTEKIAT